MNERLPEPSFDDLFRAATGNCPFSWQTRLYQQLISGCIPQRCDIPTGLGKTAIIHIWLLALAHTLKNKSTSVILPRRLVYVVDRRVVVDQATDEAEFLLKQMCPPNGDPKAELAPVIKSLREAGCFGDVPFVISTLRGQHADNRQWLRDPSCPSVVIGTVDMVGSRLLFSGYGGLGGYSRSLHAGLLGQDSLIVIDEAQLSPAFVKTLKSLREQMQKKQTIRPCHILQLTATQPADQKPGEGTDFRLGLADLEDQEVKRRFTAPKRLRFVSAVDIGKPADSMANAMASEAVSLGGQNAAVVVFANTVELVAKIVQCLKSAPYKVDEKRIFCLTGEMRAWERDKCVEKDGPGEDPVFRCFRQRRRDRGALDSSVFFVTTSAAEVGINFDADHAVCDLVSIERMVQRFGRVNRFGDGQSDIRVVLPMAPGDLFRHARDLRRLAAKLVTVTEKEQKSIQKQLAEKEHLLSIHQTASFRCLVSISKNKSSNGELDRIASPENLSALFQRRRELVSKAYTPASPPPALDDARLDDWSLTSLSAAEFPRPQVKYWLHGLTPDETPRASLVWRADLSFAEGEEDVIAMAQAIPLAPAELLQAHVGRISDLVGQLRKRDPNKWVALLTPSGEWRGITLGELNEDKKKRELELVDATLILPAELGGLEKGLLSVTSTEPVLDVRHQGRSFRRFLIQNVNGTLEVQELPKAQDSDGPGVFETFDEFLKSLGEDHKLVCISGKEDDLADRAVDIKLQQRRVAYFAVKPGVDENDGADLGALRKAPVPLDRHKADVGAAARNLVNQLGLPSDIADAVVDAAIRHDDGKTQVAWQKAIGNSPDAAPLAKSGHNRFRFEFTQGYRHEFGSFLEALKTIEKHPRRDLILHLIAAHHGHARPGFSEDSFRILPLQQACQRAAQDSQLRFACLQRQLGWWQLAYLEALVKCADAIAS